MSSSRHLMLALGTAALLAALSGCSAAGGDGSGGPSGPATGNSSASPGAGASPSGGAAAPGMTAVPTACPDPAEVSTDLGLSVTGGDGDASSGCVYSSAGRPAISINFALTPGLTPAAALAKLKSEEPTTSAFATLSGVGDAAYYDTPATAGVTGSYLVVLSGQVSFHIVVTSVISAPRLSALANHIIAGR